jgi:hypothetical protein
MPAREIRASATEVGRCPATRRLARHALRPRRIRTASVPLLATDSSVMIAAREAS